MSGLIDTLDALYRETTPGEWETRFYTGGNRKTIAVPSGFLIPDENCLSPADLCFIVEMRRNWPEIRDRLRAALIQPEGESIFAWMLDHPHDAMLAFMEATNVDTYGIERNPDGTPVREATAAEIRKFLSDRISEFMEESRRPQNGDAK